MYVETHEKLVCLSMLDVNAWGDQGEAGWVACMYVETHEKLVCLSMLDVNAWIVAPSCFI